MTLWRKFGVILIAVIVVIGLAGFNLVLFFGPRGGESPSPPEPAANLFGAEIAREIARGWILNNSPTYLFDGANLELQETFELNCPNCYGFVFTFESSAAGYGDRTNQVLAQVITPHIIAVATKESAVIQAVTDDQYDEIRQEFLSDTDRDLPDQEVDK